MTAAALSVLTLIETFHQVKEMNSHSLEGRYELTLYSAAAAPPLGGNQVPLLAAGQCTPQMTMENGQMDSPLLHLQLQVSFCPVKVARVWFLENKVSSTRLRTKLASAAASG